MPCTDDEHPAAAEAIPERAAEQDERGQGQRVAVERPLQPVEPGAEVLADGREGHVDHGGIEHGHAGTEHGGEDQPAPAGLVEPHRSTGGLGRHAPLSRSTTPTSTGERPRGPWRARFQG
jgi:hypothetical protein